MESADGSDFCWASWSVRHITQFDHVDDFNELQVDHNAAGLVDPEAVMLFNGIPVGREAVAAFNIATGAAARAYAEWVNSSSDEEIYEEYDDGDYCVRQTQDGVISIGSSSASSEYEVPYELPREPGICALPVDHEETTRRRNQLRDILRHVSIRTAANAAAAFASSGRDEGPTTGSPPSSFHSPRSDRSSDFLYEVQPNGMRILVDDLLTDSLARERFREENPFPDADDLMIRMHQSDSDSQQEPDQEPEQYTMHDALVNFVPSASAPSANVHAHTVHLAEEVFASYLVLDTGCQRCVAGNQWHKQHDTELKLNGKSHSIVPEHERYQFGAGRPQVSTRRHFQLNSTKL